MKLKDGYGNTIDVAQAIEVLRTKLLYDLDTSTIVGTSAEQYFLLVINNMETAILNAKLGSLFLSNLEAARLSVRLDQL